MFLDQALQILSVLALGIVGVATFLVAFGALQSACRAKQPGEERFELLREQAERLELLREERKTLLEELELERGARLEVQRRVKQLTREHPHLELERERQRLSEELELELEVLERERQRLSEELELEREGHLHNHHARQLLAQELEEERFARSED